MRPKKLCLCAWGPYKEKEEVDFTKFDNRGIFLITGATGAGKTTIFDAITYALYGSLSGEERDKERNSVRSDFADPQMPTYVELTMEHGGLEYQIRRNPEYLRPKKRSKKADNAPVSFTKEKENAILYYPDGRILEGVKEVNHALQELLGLDYSQFKKIVMIAQGEFARLLEASPKEKTRIFREIFGTGIYERFTQGLGVRARKLYGKVMEHKAKLAEDVRLLGVDIYKSYWSEEIKQRFLEITAVENWNYEELLNCLEQMKQQATENVLFYKKEYETKDKEVERQTRLIEEQKQINSSLEQLHEIVKEQEQLQALADEYARKSENFVAAQNAGFVEGTEEKLIQLERQIAGNEKEEKETQNACKQLEDEAKELKKTVSRADKIRELINQKQMVSKLEAEQKENQKLLQTGRTKYLKEEEACRSLKQTYEELERQRRFAAIGLVARLLEVGKPCPVCGSTEHPCPAQISEDIVSEEELDEIKEKLEQREKVLQELHGELLVRKTQVEQAEEIIARETAAFSGERDVICQKYLEIPFKQALTELQAACDRAGNIGGLLQEKYANCERLRVQREQLSKEKSATEKQMSCLLQQYGFETRESYEQAKVPRKERELLGKEIAEYQEKLTANKQLHIHLQDVTKGKCYVDLQDHVNELKERKQKRELALKAQKGAEQNRAEVKKTYKLMCEKLDLIEADSKEYGYMKDLENMANGNNSKRLVFEQYVLAGYFEEILRAANIRLRKMTSGRYEMERIGEVGDGRIKDNLEIQVMDYYTGKCRSVRTLSGGETFKASLALALGMSDVIQSMNGGIRVDTLFIDEGFGALDEESLNQACDTLMTLVEKNHLIGIISHVPELRERIENQLIIDKTGSGSTIRNSVK